MVSTAIKEETEEVEGADSKQGGSQKLHSQEMPRPPDQRQQPRKVVRAQASPGAQAASSSDILAEYQSAITTNWAEHAAIIVDQR